MEKFRNGRNRLGTHCYKWDLTKELFGKGNLLPFWVADSDYETVPKVIEDLMKRVEHGVFGYTCVDEEYRDILCKWFLKRYHYRIHRDWIVPAQGVVATLYIALELFTKERDQVVITTPVYTPFYGVVENTKRTLACNRLKEVKSEYAAYGTYVLDFQDLEEKLKEAKVYIFCNPHNPVGRVWMKEEIEKVVSLCKKYDVILISDEIHCDIIMDDHQFYSVGNCFSEYEKIIVCTAPSKTFNLAGLMCANIIIKNEEMRKLLQTRFENMSLGNPNIFGICACQSAYLYGEEWVVNQNKYLSENKEMVYQYFSYHIPKAVMYQVEGTYLMWVNLTYLGLNQDEIFNGLMEEGVLVSSGTVYASEYIGYIRLNIACGREQLTLGLDKIKNFIKKAEVCIQAVK